MNINNLIIDDILYPINEIFVTIQAEGSFSGTPSIFIRLQGCNVGCPWCDTKHTWQLDSNHQVDFLKIVNKYKTTNQDSDINIIDNTNNNNQLWHNASISTIINFINNYPQIKHIVITGGEPAKYNLLPLCQALSLLNKNIQIETSGTYELLINNDVWVTLSPKINMPNHKIIIKNTVKRANEIKMPIGKASDIEKLKQFIIDFALDTNIKIWVQPISQNKIATSLCINEAIKNNWQLSIQIHKYINIR